MSRLTTRLRFMVLGLGSSLCAAGSSQGQTPSPANTSTTPTTVAAKLQEYETKYQESLRKLHAPILQQYLSDLNSLLAITTRAGDKAAITIEIARVEKIIATGGALDLSPLPPAAQVAEGKKPGIIFTLGPGEATPPPVINAAGDSVTPIGSAAWTVSSLPAGRYSLLVHYSCRKVPPAATLSFTFAGVTKEREIRQSAATEDDKSYRILTLPLVTPKDATMELLKLTSTVSGEPWFFVRQIVIIKPKKP